jgi:predicted RNA binding protein YcfA (HicA-like mRNA interferase family)
VSRLGSIKYKDLETALKRLGFVSARQRGSHSLWKHDNGNIVVISIHKGKNIKSGLLHKIITKEIGITIEDFLKLIKD